MSRHFLLQARTATKSGSLREPEEKLAAFVELEAEVGAAANCLDQPA